ncbi:MAG TPA: Spy/CpxP family protein refolding chaperone [Burkholderiales bacterium]|nr:Spy/CpxP family protein refolding chaperone [Burkholderiales bacterium]
MSDTIPSADRPTGAVRSGRRPFLRGVLLGGLIAGAAAATGRAFAADEGCRHRWHAGAAHTPEEMRDRANRMADRLLDRVQATGEQRAKIKTIVDAATGALVAVRQKHFENRRALIDLFQQPAIDREAAQRLRAAEIQLADQTSTRLLNAVADAAEVLTLDQRKEFAQFALRHRI